MSLLSGPFANRRSGSRKTSGVNSCTPNYANLKLMAVFVACMVVAKPAFAEASTVVVPVIGQPPPPAAPVRTEEPAMQLEQVVATLPGQRLPQYQLSSHRSDQKFTDAVWFLLVHRDLGRPVLVRLEPRIDGRSFSEVHATQIAELVAATSGKEEIALDSNQQYELVSDDTSFAARYAQATGEQLGGEEASWLVNHWTSGPRLLLLPPYFQSFRAAERPAFMVLDKNSDHTISKEEIASAVVSFQDCDANRDGVVGSLEIAAHAKKKPEVTPKAIGSPLLLLVSDLLGIRQTNSKHFLRVKSFDFNGDGKVDQDEIDAIRERKPDVDVVVEFDSADPQRSELRIAANNASAATDIDGANVHIGSRIVNFTATQGSGSQISLGAVVDGYPLLPTLDPNDDGRFTGRELRSLQKRLLTFDANKDGQISVDEARSPIRVCVGLGAVAHLELGAIRRIKVSDGKSTDSAPDWFVQMDRNKDGDISRDEFSGTDEQFASMDADGDQLIGASEVRNRE